MKLYIESFCFEWTKRLEDSRGGDTDHLPCFFFGQFFKGWKEFDRKAQFKLCLP